MTGQSRLCALPYREFYSLGRQPGFFLHNRPTTRLFTARRLCGIPCPAIDRTCHSSTRNPTITRLYSTQTWSRVHTAGLVCAELESRSFGPSALCPVALGN